ncbi:toprim domain-containing protein [Flavobacterium psychrophilum]|uniref:toprim domain-containing protein n=1 Tax=Flavobacterium psychrophilum TaxID=96345 RepID=UPI000B7C357B|nr:toprim domain-containing protein [Flavobacterium psychrophilum]MCB6089575.1 toprim domain-containing protein [Flavobacterium psychrophilum]MCB6231383.1 toprim domain-containing protein [Flavobacterium psychrophilum]SNA84362.1 putative excision protein of mobilizable transposon TraP [Flavobacterium psychrophilum]
MNTAKARDILIEKVLQNLGCEPTKSNKNENWYLSPFRLEKSASFKVNRKLNRFFDHGEQIGGNVIDFVIKKFGFNVSEALDYLKKFDDFSSFQKQNFETSEEKNEIDHIEKTIPVQHPALIQYLKSRGITNYEKISNLKEIHYSIKDKKYFALGFRNDSGGFEVRSKYAKICLGKKDISHVKNKQETLKIFEGFFDALSFFQKQKNYESSDYLILNSVALLQKNISILENYDTIELYLDNDEAGDKHTNIVLENFENAVDCRAIFKGFKDYNEWFSVCELEVR